MKRIIKILVSIWTKRRSKITVPDLGQVYDATDFVTEQFKPRLSITPEGDLYFQSRMCEGTVLGFTEWCKASKEMISAQLTDKDTVIDFLVKTSEIRE